ncbi:glycoside hydrolase family 2 protein [Actinomyces urogenitalis]|uniref:glycoside hydrolase family 2 protein n=1 Tax=Actinomyces urogenitalis TaxID=103621 RepID=UPI00189B24A7|nr:glycoside hydrolase family 2 protein [Actinomyces urogenitalis]
MLTSTTLDSGWQLSLLDGPVPADLAARLRLPATVPATVPGCVHTDLLDAGLIPDPLDGDNEERLKWMWRCDWRYATTFDAAALAAGEHAELAFDGLDTIAVVAFNGTELGRTDNQFRSYRFDVTHLLREEGNELVIDFTSALNVAEERTRRYGDYPTAYPVPFSMVRKASCSFGWDWGPITITAGIWKPVRLERWTGSRLREVRLGVDLLGAGGEPLAAPVTPGQAGLVGVARLTAQVERAEGEAPTQLSYAVGGQTVTASVSEPGLSEVVLEARVAGPQAWWPRGYGEQPLYDSVLSVGGEPAWSRKVGFRHMGIDLSPDEVGAPLRLLVNGELILAKGVNWIPDDVFFTRITAADYRRALTDAVDGGCNLVRIWGGGLYESEDFYDATDELGLLVWQDFTFACAAYAEEDWLRETVLVEARQAVGRLGGRASLALWCGNNENETGYQSWGWKERLGDRAWGLGYYRELLPAIVAELDPTTPYIPASPFCPDPAAEANNDADGDTHVWDVWNDLDYLHYADHAPRFASEFGFGGPMAYSTLRAAVHDEPLSRDGAQLVVHQKADNGFGKLQRGIDNHFPEPVDFRHWHWATQLNQARAFHFGISHFRSLQPLCTGSVIWQLNDCWPVISWAVVDSAGVRKPGWYAMRHAHEDRMLVLQPAGEGKARLAAVNNLREPWHTRVRLGRGLRHGGEVTWETLDLSVEPASSTAVEVALPLEADGFLLAEADGVRRAVWFTSTDREAGLPAPQAQVSVDRVEGGYRVQVTAQVLLRDLALTADEVMPGAVVDDMLVTLLPGETATFTVRGPELADPSVLASWPVLRSANDLAS